MELWDFYEQINLSVCRLSRFEKQAAEVGLQHVSRYMWQKTHKRGTSIGNDIREVIRPHFHDHNRCTSFFCCWGGGKSKLDLEEPA